MNVHEREPGDVAKLARLIESEPKARQRDRYRMALWAIKGMEAEQIAELLGSNRRTVQEWCYRYRDHGIDGLIPIKPPGKKPLLPPEQEEAFRRRIIDGPRQEDGVCTLRAREAQRILEREFGVAYKLKSVYDLMHRLGLACLKPRPRHEQSDPEAMRTFAEQSAPPFVQTVKAAVEPRKGRVRVMFMDEARIGQQGTLTNVWAPKGSRPTAVKQTRYEWAYLYAAVEPRTGFSSALIAPSVNTQTMDAFLEILSGEVEPGDFVVLIMDQAGWHKSGRLRVPDNIVILLLPPKSPEINPVERLWHFMRSHYLSNRAYHDYDHIRQATGEAYRALTPTMLRSVCRCDYIERAL